MLDLIRIRKSFSKASLNYEKNALLQRRIGQEFLESIKNRKIRPERILDIGMGTGWFSSRASGHFGVDIIGIDSAYGMVLTSKGKRELLGFVAEAQRLPFKDRSFDCIISNLTYQWVIDLDIAFSECFRILRPGAVFYFNCFAQETLKELRTSFDFTSAQRDSLFGFHLPDENKISSSLKKNGFKVISLLRKNYYPHFNNMLSLLKWLKAIGANTTSKPHFIKRADLYKADDFYCRHFKSNGQVYATFKVIQVQAQR